MTMNKSRLREESPHQTAVVKVTESQLRAVFGHNCDQPDCPVCKGESMGKFNEKDIEAEADRIMTVSPYELATEILTLRAELMEAEAPPSHELPGGGICSDPYHRPTSIYCLMCLPSDAPLGALLLSNREPTAPEIERGLEIAKLLELRAEAPRQPSSIIDDLDAIDAIIAEGESEEAQHHEPSPKENYHADVRSEMPNVQQQRMEIGREGRERGKPSDSVPPVPHPAGAEATAPSSMKDEHPEPTHTADAETCPLCISLREPKI